MVKSILAILFALVLGFSATNHTVACGDPKASVMTVEVKKLSKSNNAEELKAQLMQVKGVSDVTVDKANGTVVIQYDEPTMGCCSVLHSSLKSNGWKYKLVSNKETPACSHGHNHSHAH